MLGLSFLLDCIELTCIELACVELACVELACVELIRFDFAAKFVQCATHSCQCCAERDFKFIGDLLERLVLVDPHLDDDAVMFGELLDRLADSNGCFGQDNFVGRVGAY